jgi:hypothetical protein
VSDPKRDPSVAMADVNAAASAFLAAGQAYWDICRKAGLDVGAVTWVEDSHQGLAIFTRGEYRGVILRNIPEVGRTYSLGGTIAEDA